MQEPDHFNLSYSAKVNPFPENKTFATFKPFSTNAVNFIGRILNLNRSALAEISIQIGLMSS